MTHNTIDLLIILLESFAKSPSRIDHFMFKWMGNLTRVSSGCKETFMGALSTMVNTLIGRDLAPVVKNSHIFLFGENSPFFIAWCDLTSQHERVVFKRICVATQKENVQELPAGKVDFTHAVMRFLLITLAIGSDDRRNDVAFLRVYDMMLIVIQRARVLTPARAPQLAMISRFLQHVAIHPLPPWDPYFSIIPAI
jgi:hypothetical protein